MKMTCMIVDDELLARKLLTDYIGKIPNLELVAACPNAMEAQAVLQKQPVDLLFLDIQMPELTGIQFLQNISPRPVTIFTTAYAAYALKGFELAVLDYLVKPIAFDRFFQAVSRAAEYIRYTHTPPLPAMSAGETPNEADFMFVKSDYRMQKVILSDIDYIEAYGEYIFIHCGRQRVMTLVALGKIEEKLPKERFIRVHRSFIVNISKITSVQGNAIHVAGKEIPVSKSHRDAVVRWVNERSIND